MTSKLNETILSEILKLIPENIKPVNLFMDVLDIGKESAYRRLRGEKALSFEEVYKLSMELNFSLDDITGNKVNGIAKFIHLGTPEQSPEIKILDFFNYYENHLQRIISTDNSEIINTANHILNTMFVGYENLFKFFYYRWTHQMTEVPLNYRYSDLVIPTNIKELCNIIDSLHKKIKKITFIIDNYSYLHLIKEMQYFYIRGILNKTDLEILQEDLLKFMENTQIISNKGANSSGTIYEVYLSTFHINSTTSYTIWGNNEESAFWHHYGYPIITNNKDITKKHKIWLESIKKYCAIMSQSNELLQAEFFNKQREYIEKMTDNIIL